MKKAICVLLAILMVTCTLAGCGKDTAAETTTATTAVETTAEGATTAAPVLTDEQILALSAPDFAAYLFHMNVDGLTESEIIEKSTDLTVKQFLYYIKNKQVADIVYFIRGYDHLSEEPIDAETYAFFKNVDVDAYEITEISKDSSGYLTSYKVTLNISKSSSALFPVGKSDWIINARADFDYDTLIRLFRNANDTSTILRFASIDETVRFCYDVSVYLGCFETMDDFNKLVEKVQGTDNFHWFCDFFVNLLLRNSPDYDEANAYSAKRTELETLAKAAFDITNIDFKKYKYYNSTDDTVNVPGHGAPWVNATLSSSTYNRDTRISTIVIDYYADAAHLLIAKSMKYTLRVNADDSLTLLATQLVYDSGYDASKMYFS